MTSKVASTILMKGISIKVLRRDWMLLRNEALRRNTTISDVVRQWIEPEMERLRPDDFDTEPTA